MSKPQTPSNSEPLHDKSNDPMSWIVDDLETIAVDDSESDGSADLSDDEDDYSLLDDSRIYRDVLEDDYLDTSEVNDVPANIFKYDDPYDTDIDFFYDPTLGSYEIANGRGRVIARGEHEDSFFLDLSAAKQAGLLKKASGSTIKKVAEDDFNGIASGAEDGWLSLNENDDDDLVSDYENDDDRESAFELFEEDDAEKFVGEIWASSFGDDGWKMEGSAAKSRQKSLSAIASLTKNPRLSKKAAADKEARDDYQDSLVVDEGNEPVSLEEEEVIDPESETIKDQPKKKDSFVLLDYFDASDSTGEDGEDDESEDEFSSDTEFEPPVDDDPDNVTEMVATQGETLLVMSQASSERIHDLKKLIHRVQSHMTHLKRRIDSSNAAVEEMKSAKSKSGAKKVAGAIDTKTTYSSEHPLSQKEVRLLLQEEALLRRELLRYEKMIEHEEKALEDIRKVFMGLHDSQ